LRRPFPSTGWTREQFVDAGREGKRRWEEAQELFGLQWPMFEDAVSLVAPSFEMESDLVDVAEATDVPTGRNTSNRIALWFMRWARCPRTAEYPNPYEPWIEIWENGGAFGVEHGRFVDLYDAAGMPLGAIVVRRA
jgi:hypothetical protein